MGSLLVRSNLLLFLVLVLEAYCQGRHARSAAITNLSEETSNILGELVAAINPVYVAVIGVFIVAGCAFELAYGSRRSGTPRSAHVASRNAAFSVRTDKI